MSVHEGELKRISHVPDEQNDTGTLIAGQEWDNVEFGGGSITNVTINNPSFGTPLSLSNGGTGAALPSPGDDRILFWDQSANSTDWLIPGSGLSIVDKTIVVAGAGLGDVTGPMTSADNGIARFNGLTGKVIQNSGATIDDLGNIAATNLSGTNTGDQTITLSGAVTGSGTGNITTTFRDSVGVSVIGRSANTLGTPADITASSDFQVLRRSGSSIGFGPINLSSGQAVSGTLAEGRGGTGNTSYTTGDVLYSSATNTLSKLPIGSNGQILTITAGLPAWSSSTIPTSASQAQQETASSTNVYSSPGTQQYHPSACKAWGNFNGTGTPAIRAGYNFASITDNGAGNYTVNFVNPMSSANYCPIVNYTTNSSTPQVGWQAKAFNLTTGGFSILTGNDGTTGATPTDAAIISFVVFGDM